MVQDVPQASGVRPFDESSAAETHDVWERFEQIRATSTRPFSSCFDLGDGRVVKRGDARLCNEANTIEFIRNNTTIPVPRVYMLFQKDGEWFLVMEAIMGTTLESHYKRLPVAQLVQIAKTLKGYVEQLKSLGTCRRTMGSWPSGPFRNVYYTQVFHHRFQVPLPTIEYTTIDEFHAYWLERLGDHPARAGLSEAISRGSKDVDVVLVHGDLNPQNIMISDDGHILSILDWDTCGWYPHFWDRMAMRRSGIWSRNWREALDAVFGIADDMEHTYCTLLDHLADDYFFDDELLLQLSATSQAPS
ncbi:kinase-like domain-containing protein [Mycena rebaudengoi]|nr:kinase-like domain-containing protein [Mycena rebaudengoi]